MSKLDAASATIINEQVAAINAAHNHGTLDKAAIDAACDKLLALAKAEPVPAPGGLGGNAAAQNRAGSRPHVGEPVPTNPLRVDGNGNPIPHDPR